MKTYIDICDNFRFFLRINHRRLKNRFLKRRILLLKFFFFTNFNIVSEKIYRRKRIIIFYTKKNKDKSKISKKISKILKNEEKNKVILSKQILELIQNSKYDGIQEYIRYKDENKNNFYKQIVSVIDFVMNQKKQRIEENNIHILSKKNNVIYHNNIIYLAKKCKSFNIITPNIKEYHKIEEKIYNSLGTHITVSNNKRKSLANAKYIINIDFTEDDIRKYNLYRNATIFNMSPYKLLRIKGFEGMIVNNVILKEKDNSFTRMRDRRFEEIYDDNFLIIALIGNNGTISKMY